MYLYVCRTRDPKGHDWSAGWLRVCAAWSGHWTAAATSLTRLCNLQPWDVRVGRVGSSSHFWNQSLMLGTCVPHAAVQCRCPPHQHQASHHHPSSWDSSSSHSCCSQSHRRRWIIQRNFVVVFACWKRNSVDSFTFNCCLITYSSKISAGGVGRL